MLPASIVVMIATVVPADADLPAVYLDGPAEIVEPVRESVKREHPDLKMVEVEEQALLRFRIARVADAWVVQIALGDETMEVRSLGSDVPAAVRLATLIILQTAAKNDWSTTPPAAPLTAGTSTIPSAEAAVSATPALDAPAGRPRLAVEAGAALVGWGAPGAVRLGGTAAAHVRLLDWAALGLRMVVAGACCRVRGDNVEADTLVVAGLVEAKAALSLGPAELWLLLAGGLGWERVAATVVDLFAGPTAPETHSVLGGAGRLGAGASVELFESFGVWASAGVQAHSRALRISAPPPYSEGLEPLERAALVPFLEVGLMGAFF